MPQGRFSLADVDAPPQSGGGRFSAADLDDTPVRTDMVVRSSNARDDSGRVVVRDPMAALPMIGGMVGGLAGGRVSPTGMTLAGLGGAVGQGVREVVDAVRDPIRRTSGPMDTLSQVNAPLVRMARAGAEQAGLEGLGRGVTGAVTKGAQAVYRGYLKPSLSQSLLPKAQEIVKTAIEEALPISRAGKATGLRLISEINQQVSGLLKHSTEMVDLHAVAERVRKFAAQRYNKPGSNPSNFEAAMAVADRLDNHPALGLPAGAKPSRVDVPVGQANEVKRALGADAGDNAFGVKSNAQKSTEKFGYGSLRRAIEQKVPEIAPLNARESKLIDATKTIARAVEREANQNQVYGMKSLVAGGLGGSAYAAGQTDPAGAAGYALALRVGLHPAVASRVAITAARTARAQGVAAATAARLALFAVQSSEDGQ